MKKIKFMLIGFFFLFFFGISPNISAKAYSTDELGDYTKIGQFDSNGYSYVGVSISLDGEVKYYAVDTWKKQGDEWVCLGTNYNGIKRDGSTVYMGRNEGNPIELCKTSYRFCLTNRMIFENMPSVYSLVSRGMCQGKDIYNAVDFSFEDHASRKSESFSLFYDNLTKLSMYGPAVPSFTYNFYSTVTLGESDEVRTSIPDGAYFTETGEAYVTSGGYYIDKLPKVKYTKPGYTVEFEGWYDKETGGNKIQEKTEISYGTRLYAHFAVSANHYTVTCYDIHGTDISGRELGKTVFTAVQGEKVSGASLGCDTKEGAYYDGYIYHSGTEKTVYYDTTIYRFFTYPYYDVTYVDQVSGGKETGKVLRSEVQQKELYSEVSGEELGTLSDSGEYYKGYCYSGASRAVVSKEGTTVYRYFKPHQYRILFDGNGATKGSMREMEDCLYGDEFALLPNSYQKEITIHFDLNTQDASCKTSELTISQKFSGWSLEPDGSLLCDDKALISNLTDHAESVTLYAVWSEEKTSIDVVPEKQGYRFTGWSEKADDTKGNTQFTFEGDTTLYAVWKADISKYHVEYYKENAEGIFHLDSSYTYEGYSEQEVSLDTEKINFQGYDLDKEASVLSGTIEPDGSLILSVYFRRKVYSVAYDMNGGMLKSGSLQPTQVFQYGAELTVSQLPEAEKAGYTLAGWSFSENGETQIYHGGDTIKMPNHDTTLYAVWKPVVYYITYDANAAVTGSKTKKTEVEYGKAVELWNSDFVRKGYVFHGWNTKSDLSGKSYQAGDLVENLTEKEGENITLYADWTPIHMEIHYDSNKSKEMLSEVSGYVADTEYQYENGSRASSAVFYAEGYEMSGWNTRADGSGITVKPGADLSRVFSEGNEAVLYAVWKPSENTAFTLKLYKESTKELLKTLVLEGITGEKISSAIHRIYEKTLGEDQVWQFYEGYEVVNKEVLEDIIKPDGSTSLSCNLVTRTCEVTLVGDSKGTGQTVTSEKLTYKDSYTLPKELDNGTINVDRYRDSDGKTYETGEKVTLEKNKTFYVQHLVRFFSDSEELKEKASYIDHGVKIMLPVLEKKGYQFLGWKEKNQDAVYTGESLGEVLKGYDLYAVWSEPLSYQITYEVEDYLVKIAENRVSTYQYGTETLLPDKMQVIVEEGYEFKGWYIKDDPSQTLLTKISREQTGNLVLKAKLGKTESAAGQKDPAAESVSQAPENKDAAANEPEAGKEKTEETGNTESGPSSEISSEGSASQSEKSSQTAQTDLENPSLDSMKQNADDTKKEKKVTAFWSGNIKYQIVSQKKKTVRIAGNKVKTSSLTISGKVRFQGKTYSVISVGKKAFYKNNSVKKLVISSGIKKIGDSAFGQMKKLTKITIGKAVTSVGKKAFYGNKGIRKITILSKKLKTVQKTAFKSIGKKAVFKVPAGKKAAYKKLLPM